MSDTLPNGWVEVKLEKLLEFLESGSRPKGGVRGIDNGLPSLGGEHLNYNGGFNFDTMKFIPKGFATKMNKGRIKLNDILIVKDGATTGKTSYIDKNFPYEEAYVNEHVFICRLFNQLNSKYVFYYLWSREGQERILKNFKGSAQGGINKSFSLNTLIPLAPLPEQKNIVSALDIALARVQSIQEQLVTVPKILKQFRQRVLSAAISGNLTEDWRDANSTLQHWKEVFAADACETVASGSTPKGKPFSAEGEIPYLKVYNIVNQQIDFYYKPQFITRKIHEKELKRCRVYPKDVIINIVGPPLGKVALVPDYFEEWNINQAIVVFRPKKNELKSEYLYYLFCEGSPFKGIENETRGTAGQINISLSQCRGFVFNLPSLDEQEEIVRRTSILLSWADKLESNYKKTKIQIDEIPYSILAKAFSGKLIEQDRRDEPIDDLLKQLEGNQLRKQQHPTEKQENNFLIEKRQKMSEQLRSIKDILSDTQVPLSTYEVWKKSIHKDDIEAFYNDLKHLVDIERSVEDIKEGEQSYLKLSHAH